MLLIEKFNKTTLKGNIAQEDGIIINFRKNAAHNFAEKK